MTAASERPLCVHLLPETHDAGAENQARYLVAGLAAQDDFELEIAYFAAGRAQHAFETLGLPMLNVPRLRRFRYDAYGRVRRLRRSYAGHEPDIFHTWMLEGNVIGLMAARAWSNTKVVITQRGSWNELDYRGLVRIQRLLLGRADHAISNSHGGREMLELLGMERERISVVPNGIPQERVATSVTRSAVRRKHAWEGKQIIVWVGRANDVETVGQKDLTTLFAAIRKLRATHPDAELAVIGATDAELRAVGLERPECAVMHGWQPRPADFLIGADLLVLSSRAEGHSNVVGEALMSGLPVVSTDCGDHCEAVRLTGGRVTPVGNPTELAQAIGAMLDAPPAREQVRAAAQRALAVERIVADTAAIYRRLLTT